MTKRSLIAVAVVFGTVSVLLAAHNFGDYGYTYWISPGTNQSVYNIMGQTEFTGNKSARAQTYASRQSGPTITEFDILRLRGRVWRQPQTPTGCPLSRAFHQQKDCFNCSGALNSWHLHMPFMQDRSVYPTYAIGKHRLIHTNTLNPNTGAPPRWFYVWTDDDTNPSSPNQWSGIAFQCPAPPSGETLDTAEYEP